jgi:stress response protein YsnF
VAARDRQNREIIPVVAERAVVRKRKQITGAVRVRTEVHEHTETVEETVATEEIDVTRVPVDRWVDEAVPVRREGDVTIIPVHEEVLVVEKRLKLVAELHVTRRRSSRPVTERLSLRREEAVVERLAAPDDEPT